MLRFAVDFDGTIVDANEDDFPKFGELKPYALKVLQALKSRGHILYLWTCREGMPLFDALTFLSEQGLEFDYINSQDKVIIEAYGPKRKIYADYYLDDKSFPPFPGWLEFFDYLKYCEPRF